MLNFVARVFRGWMNAVLWLILIGCAIGGFVAFGLVFSGYRESFNGGYAFLGLLLGGFIGLITVILSGGLIANFLNMVDNVEKQNAILMHVYGKDLPKDLFKNIVNKNISSEGAIGKDEAITIGAEYLILDEKRLWKEASFSSEIIVYLTKGSKIKIISEKDDAGTKWLYVESDDGNNGYTIKGDIKPV